MKPEAMTRELTALEQAALDALVAWAEDESDKSGNELMLNLIQLGLALGAERAAAAVAP